MSAVKWKSHNSISPFQQKVKNKFTFQTYRKINTRFRHDSGEIAMNLADWALPDTLGLAEQIEIVGQIQ